MSPTPYTGVFIFFNREILFDRKGGCGIVVAGACAVGGKADWPLGVGFPIG
jgi:hypothetical protein